MTAPAKVRPARGRGASTPTATPGTRTAGTTGTVEVAPRPRQASTARPVMWLVGPTPRRAPRTPFVLLIVGLLVFGLVGLLLLNTATASASFRERSLQEHNNALTLRQQELQREVSAAEAPQALAKAAAGLGMVPGPDPAFLELLKNGSSKVIGDPAATTAPVPPPPPPTQPSQTPTPTPTHKQTKTPTHKATHTPTAHHTTAVHTTAAQQHRQANGGHR